MAKKVRFTIFDKMENDGVFEKNSANISSPNYERVAYPRVLYHPLGEEEVVHYGEVIMTPYGPKEFNRQTRLIYKIAKNAAEEAELLADGWHKHPADAVAASGKPRPITSSAARVSDLEARIAELEAEKNGQIAQQAQDRNPLAPLVRKTKDAAQAVA